MPTPVAVGVSAKPRVVLRAVSVPAMERMPLANDPVAEAAVVAVPSTRNVTGPAGLAGAGVVGAVVDVPGVVVGVSANDPNQVRNGPFRTVVESVVYQRTSSGPSDASCPFRPVSNSA